MTEKINPFWLAEQVGPGEDELALSREWVDTDKASEELSLEERDVAATGAAYGLLAGRIESKDEIDRLKVALRMIRERLTPTIETVNSLREYIDSVLA